MWFRGRNGGRPAQSLQRPSQPAACRALSGGTVVCFRHCPGDPHAESWALSVIATRTARRFNQRASLTARQCRQCGLLLGEQQLTPHCSGRLERFIEMTVRVGKHWCNDAAESTVEAEELSLCSGWHAHLQACAAASIRPADRSCCLLPAGMHKCRVVLDAYHFCSWSGMPFKLNA